MQGGRVPEFESTYRPEIHVQSQSDISYAGLETDIRDTDIHIVPHSQKGPEPIQDPVARMKALYESFESKMQGISDEIVQNQRMVSMKEGDIVPNRLLADSPSHPIPNTKVWSHSSDDEEEEPLNRNMFIMLLSLIVTILVVAFVLKKR